MNVLIFGITGNSGRELASYYLGLDANVYGVGRSKCDLEGVKYFQGDIRDTNLYKNLPCNLDLVVNFAGVQPSILNTSESTDLYKTLSEYIDVNIKGVYNIIEWVSKNNINCYIYATSHRDYENYWKDGNPLTNKLPPAINYEGDHTMYAISKLSGMMIGDYLLPLKEVRCFNLRLPMIFQIPQSPYYLSNGKKVMMPFLKIIKDALNGKDLEIWGDPYMPRDYVYVDNLIQLIEKCFQSTLRKGTFNVGTGEGVTTEKFIKNISKVFSPNQNTKFIYRPEKNTYKSAVYNIDEQRKFLNYKPILLDEMLIRMKNKIESELFIKKWGWDK